MNENKLQFMSINESADSAWDMTPVDAEGIINQLRTSNEVLYYDVKRLVTACRAMMECAGPSDNWNGDTHDALRLIENAVAAATEGK